MTISGPGEDHVEKLAKFVAEYGADLRGMEQALDETAADVWDPHADAIALSHEPAEQCQIHALIDTDNKEMTKVMAAILTPVGVQSLRLLHQMHSAAHGAGNQ